MFRIYCAGSLLYVKQNLLLAGINEDDLNGAIVATPPTPGPGARAIILIIYKRGKLLLYTFVRIQTLAIE